MPMKFPKGFQRRKSSGQALEEVLNPPQSSFRVLERTPESTKSFDGGNTGRRTNDVRPVSEGQYLDYQEGKFRPNVGPYSRGSGGTQNSASSGVYDASSARYSSSSTLPSSSSVSIHDDPTNSHPKPISATTLPSPAAPSPKFLRAASRTFSFGAKKATETTPRAVNDIRLPHHSTDFSDIPDVLPQLRQRAMTETSHASGSTATPPKLGDADGNWTLSLGTGGEDDFSNMFDTLSMSDKGKLVGIGGSLDTRQYLPPDDNPLKRPSYAPPPPPVHIDRSKNITPAPRSAVSHTSQDRLVNDSPYAEQDGRPYSYTHKRYSSSYLKSRNLTGSPGTSNPLMSAYDSPNFQAHDGHRMSTPILDDDAKAVLSYLHSGPQSPKYAPVPTSAPTPPLHTESPTPINQIDREVRRKPVTLYDGYNQDNDSIQNSPPNSLTTTPKAFRALPEDKEDEVADDSSFQEMARSAARIEAGETPAQQEVQRPPLGKKVMSGAEFERYKKEQELYRRNSDGSESEKSENSSVDGYDDEDDMEKTKQITQQRRKQEAKMSVYRQQMMKITGERTLPSQQPSSSRVPGLTTKLSATNLKDKSASNRSSEDEDDDVPLGILAAHGFPSKERAPSHLQRMSSSPNIRYQSETYPPPVPPMPGQGGQTLPVFARHLPQDPYFGAGLVNQAVREPLGYSSGTSPGSVYGGSQSGGPAAPPGGLVGVIAKEERARALRRGSPNHNTSTSFETFNSTPNLPLPQGMMMSPPLASPESQAQIQMNQQMTQMMQMQMQWMQQMMQMQMQAGQGMPGMPMMPTMPGMPPMPGMPQMTPQHQQRQSHSGPTTPNAIQQNQYLGIPSNNGLRPPSSASQFNPTQGWRQSNASSLNRTSTAPSFLNQGLAQGYAPSIAPSERSNVGQPTRYRPVSNVTPDGRASTMGAQAGQSWNLQRESSTLGTSSGIAPMGNQIKKAATATVRPVVRDEDDDEEGWEEMRRQREGKKKQWRRRQSQSEALSGNGSEGTKGVKGLEGVFYPTELA